MADGLDGDEVSPRGPAARSSRRLLISMTPKITAFPADALICESMGLAMVGIEQHQ
jgi:hypothetical protein